ncbi:MAG: type IV conjugative transfer system protein TraE [Simkaniaceae bacterium]|nr:type IV conjugative transfer system protein TraE [Simkaniaceae bacterium]
MDAHSLKNNICKLVQQRNIFLCFSLLSITASLVLAILLFNKNEKVIVVPTIGASFWIENTQTSSTYLENMGTFLSDLLLNRSPADVEWKNKTLLSHIHPAYYHEISQILKEEKTNILKQNQSIVFRPLRSFVDTASKQFIIEGERLVLVSQSKKLGNCAQQDKKRYILGFQCENSRLSLISLKQEEI